MLVGASCLQQGLAGRCRPAALTRTCWVLTTTTGPLAPPNPPPPPGFPTLALLGTGFVFFFQQAELSAAFWENGGRGFPWECRGQVRC